ncbi:ECs_2282 family putative zinc-binding protein [Pseudomonas helleri]|uniref:ECs_2282 family putative zinc-binding protein n=1 Tax=Pseudomonas helleri TaxID=1608996 RepID=UPI003F996AEB
MNIELQCSDCDCKDFKHPDDLNDDSIIICDDCGASCPYGELRDEALAKAKDFFDGKFRNIFKS